jgi:hypothetical protein
MSLQSASPAALVQLERRPPAAACCELCGHTLAKAHAHLVDVQQRTLRCACAACGMLFDTIGPHRYRRVTPKVERLTDIRLSANMWEALRVPVGLAFFVISSRWGAAVAGYPGPAGTLEATVDPSAWSVITRANPVLDTLAPDVEAWLVNRLAPEVRSYRVSIDHCYELSGIMRSRWRGIAGGDAVHAAIDAFFASLDGHRER